MPCSWNAATASRADSSSNTKLPLLLSTVPQGASRTRLGIVPPDRVAERNALVSRPSLITSHVPHVCIEAATSVAKMDTSHVSARTLKAVVVVAEAVVASAVVLAVAAVAEMEPNQEVSGE